MVKSPITVCNEIFIEMRKMHKTLDRGRHHAARSTRRWSNSSRRRAPKWLAEMEEMAGKDDPGEERPCPAPGAVRHSLRIDDLKRSK